jgi:hypothetical protein
MTGPRECQEEDDKNEETGNQENENEPEEYDESNDIMPVNDSWFELIDDGVICCANLLKKT